MTDDVFGASLNRNIDAQFKRTAQDRGRPGVIKHDFDATIMGRGGNRGDVLHFKGQRPRAFTPDQNRIVTDKSGDIAANGRVVIFGFNTKAFQEGVAQIARREIGAVGDQNVIARFDKGEDRIGDGRCPGGYA